MPENATHVIVASLEEPTAFSDSPRAPLPSTAMVTGDAVPSEDKFLFMFFKCLSKLQTSGTCQRAGLCPAPSPPHPALSPRQRALVAAPHQGPQRSAGRTTARAGSSRPRQAGFVPLSCAFLGVFLLMVLRSWFREHVKEPA